MEPLIATAAISMPFIIALTEVVKRTVPEIPARFNAVISIAAGFAWTAITMNWSPVNGWQEFATISVVSGLMASGLYSAGVKAVVEKVAPTK